MAKISLKPGTMLNPVPVVMVSCGDQEKSNIITIAWTGIVNSNPPMTYIAVQRSRYSYNIIKEHGEFVIFPWNADDHVCNALVDSGIFRDEEDHISTSRFHLADIRDRLCENMLLGRDRDDRNMVCDQSDGSVL